MSCGSKQLSASRTERLEHGWIFMPIFAKVQRLYRLFTRLKKNLPEPQSGDELVSQPRYSHDHGRLLGILFQLLAQAAYVHVNSASECVFVITPDFFQQHLARKRRARILREITQQAEFARGKGNDFTIAKHGCALEVDP